MFWKWLKQLPASRTALEEPFKCRWGFLLTNFEDVSERSQPFVRLLSLHGSLRCVTCDTVNMSKDDRNLAREKDLRYLQCTSAQYHFP